jgi:hypothetical protein
MIELDHWHSLLVRLEIHLAEHLKQNARQDKLLVRFESNSKQISWGGRTHSVCANRFSGNVRTSSANLTVRIGAGRAFRENAEALCIWWPASTGRLWRRKELCRALWARGGQILSSSAVGLSDCQSENTHLTHEHTTTASTQR